MSGLANSIDIPILDTFCKSNAFYQDGQITVTIFTKIKLAVLPA